MGRFLTEHEAAAYLKLPPQAFKSLEIHKCPHGYSVDHLDEYISEHGLPVGKPKNVLGVGGDDELIEWFDSIESMLLRADNRTSAMLVPSDSPNLGPLWLALKETGVRLITVGQKTEEGHLTFPTWEEAIQVARTFYEVST